jgi:hypothetical protein
VRAERLRAGRIKKDRRSAEAICQDGLCPGSLFSFLVMVAMVPVLGILAVAGSDGHGGGFLVFFSLPLPFSFFHLLYIILFSLYFPRIRLTFPPCTFSRSARSDDSLRSSSPAVGSHPLVSAS